jgi:nicotinate phosphoribosyltransferase
MTSSALATDLYEIAMLAGYCRHRVAGRATFELYVRELPPRRSFLVAAGLDQALGYLEQLRFTAEEIAYLRGLPNLRTVQPAFFEEYLPAFRFTGDVWAPAEGTPVFAHEPFLRVTAPVPEAQLVETALLASITFPTSVASKTARVVDHAGGREVMEFGSRRAHGLDAARLAARAAYLAGCASTSNVEAGFLFGIPVSGTMAHSWVMAFADELEAFRAYDEAYGERSVFLIDTYDSLAAARLIAASGLRPAAVRIDSGDLVALTAEVRRVFDRAGLGATKILVSGDLDEDRVAELLAAGAPIDGFGVGTAISTSKDAPALGGVYKLVEIDRGAERVPVVKRSPGKRSYPGAKQVWRRFDDKGGAVGDLLGLADETAPPAAVPLLEQVMLGGRRTREAPALRDLRDRCLAGVGALPEAVRRLSGAATYPIEVTARLDALADRLDPRA